MQEFLKSVDIEVAVKLPLMYDMTDTGKNVIHKCAQVKSFLILEEVIEFYRKNALLYLYEENKTTKEDERENRKKVKQEIVDWVNARTDCNNGFSPIHFACYHGDADVMRMLVKYGAKLNVVNKQMLSPMHVAA